MAQSFMQINVCVYVQLRRKNSTSKREGKKSEREQRERTKSNDRDYKKMKNEKVVQYNHTIAYSNTYLKHRNHRIR